jgi:hypothetical protein
MPFTATATLRLPSDGSTARGAAMLFRKEEAEWAVDWYEEETAIPLPDPREWLANARDEHRWYATFRPASNEHVPMFGTNMLLELEVNGEWYPVEWLDEIHGVLGKIPWLVLAGSGDPPLGPPLHVSESHNEH